MQESKLVSINDAARMLGIGRSTLYLILKDGQLPARKLGKRTLILRSDIESFVEALPLNANHK